jgi:putative MFS transporter
MHRKFAFVLGIGTFFDLYDIFLGGLLGAVLKPLFHLDTTQTALLISASFIGMFVGAIIFGIISDYLGRRAMYMVNLLFYSLFSLAAAFSPTYIWVVLFRLLAGLGLGGETALMDIYMGEMIPRYARGRFTAWSYTLGFLGVPMAAFVGRFIVPYTFLSLSGWRWLLIVGSLGALIVWFLRRNLPESPRWFEIRNKPSVADMLLHRIEREAMAEHGLKKLPEPEPVVVQTQKRATVLEIFSKLYAQRTIMLCIFQLLQTVGYYGFGSLAPIVLRAKGFSIVDSLGYTALTFLGYPLGSLLSIPLVERFERKWLIVGSAILMAVLGLSFGLTTFVPLIVASGFLLTTVSNIFGIALHIYQAEIFPTRMRGTAVGITYSLSRLTSAALPFAALPILQVYGPVAVFSGSALMLCILCLDVGILGPKSTGQSLEAVAM